MTRVSDLLANKGSRVWTIGPEATVYDAVAAMAERGVGALVVVDAEGTVIGIITERDYARKIILAGRASKTTAVSTVMTRRVIYVEPGRSIESCMALMTQKRVRHLPVLEGGRLSGLVSIGDVVKAVVSEKEFVIDQLVQYIAGR